jgi:hypothetical protein
MIKTTKMLIVNVFYWKHYHGDHYLWKMMWFWKPMNIEKIGINLFVWVPLIVKKYVHTIEDPCQWILPIRLQTMWENGEGRG